jgi:large subunit ribosomal protein L21
MSMMAIIEVGGKQYVVRENQEIRLERLQAEEGSKVTFENVLLLSKDEKEASLGAPFLAKQKVTATVVSQGRDEKVWGIKHKAKKRYKVKFGHKQLHTIVKIDKIA